MDYSAALLKTDKSDVKAMLRAPLLLILYIYQIDFPGYFMHFDDYLHTNILFTQSNFISRTSVEACAQQDPAAPDHR